MSGQHQVRVPPGARDLVKKLDLFLDEPVCPIAPVVLIMPFGPFPSNALAKLRSTGPHLAGDRPETDLENLSRIRLRDHQHEPVKIVFELHEVKNHRGRFHEDAIGQCRLEIESEEERLRTLASKDGM
jgi:hypothetical protein